MEQQKKRRSENWNSEEKEILRQLISQSAHILENKCNKTSINLVKSNEWKKVMTKLHEITGKNRSDSEIKLAWKRMKLAAKANLSAHKQLQIRTGGGEKPPSPSQEDLSIMAIAPHDFIIEVNDYDSDAVQAVAIDKKSHEEVIAGPSTCIHRVSAPETIDVIPTHTNIKEIKTPKEKRNKNVPQNLSQVMRESIVESNVNFKKRQLEMLEIEHQLNIKIAHLKIRKLELEISLLENKNSFEYEVPTE